MEEFLDVIYNISKLKESEKYSNAIGILKEKEKLESEFSKLLLKNQEIPFDNFMDSLDKCNDELNKLAFKSGFTLAVTMIKDIMNYSQNISDVTITELIQNIKTDDK